ncbi:sodium-dependent glucose transporter 1B-like isoform X1 [Dreissena polymorpha]|uniref:Uncharacterized protein n=2 Tax=Dreissena polymorpha TaxID=45954 RepID=A0A9D4CRI6_DREPO|nr:sodium-dependent glucose transporter 1B-like isoform X1 [Dreissena polymorpha]KAH3729322.1 hypothetical protein DPMN_055289 [Dreissena polymorpha]
MSDTNRKLITVMLVLVWISMGLFFEVGGPTMVDLRMKFNTSSADIARSVSAQGFGIFAGALAGGLVIDAMRTWKFLVVTLAETIATVAVILMPFVASLTWLWVMFFSVGTAAGLINVAGQRMLIELWRDESASPMHAMHMGFGIGALLAPIIINPFLAVLEYGSVNASSNDVTLPGGRDFIVIKESRVNLAFVTIGLCSATLALPVFLYPFVKCFRRYKNKYNNMDEPEESTVALAQNGIVKRLLVILNPATYANGNFKLGLTVFVFIIVLYINLVGGEQLFGNFVRTFSVDELRFARNEASYLDTVYWGSFTIGRLTGSVLAHFISMRKLFLIDLFMNLLAVTFADIFAARGKNFLWAFTAIVGFFIAPLFPAGIAYINTHIEVGGMVLTLVVFATGFGQLLYVWIEGLLYEAYGPRTILYAMQFSAIFLCLISVIFVAISWTRKRFAINEDQTPVVTSGEDIRMTSDLRYSDMNTSS